MKKEVVLNVFILLRSTEILGTQCVFKVNISILKYKITKYLNYTSPCKMMHRLLISSDYFFQAN